MNKIIINGRAGAGKDTIADYLVDKYGFTKLTFATGIYDIAYKYFGMKEKDRYLLQQIGEKMREINPDVWVEYTFSQAEKLNRTVVSDCRRSNEYNIAIKNGFVPIRVSASFENRYQRIAERDGLEPDTSLWENDSEVGADNFEYIEFNNDGTLEELYQKIDEFMERLK